MHEPWEQATDHGAAQHSHTEWHTVHTDLEVGCEGIWQSHVAREGTENEVPHLDTVGRDDITEREVIVTEKLGEVMEEDQQHSQGALGDMGREVGRGGGDSREEKGKWNGRRSEGR